MMKAQYIYKKINHKKFGHKPLLISSRLDFPAFLPIIFCKGQKNSGILVENATPLKYLFAGLWKDSQGQIVAANLPQRVDKSGRSQVLNGFFTLVYLADFVVRRYHRFFQTRANQVDLVGPLGEQGPLFVVDGLAG